MPLCRAQPCFFSPSQHLKRNLLLHTSSLHTLAIIGHNVFSLFPARSPSMTRTSLSLLLCFRPHQQGEKVKNSHFSAAYVSPNLKHAKPYPLRAVLRKKKKKKENGCARSQIHTQAAVELHTCSAHTFKAELVSAPIICLCTA